MEAAWEGTWAAERGAVVVATERSERRLPRIPVGRVAAARGRPASARLSFLPFALNATPFSSVQLWFHPRAEPVQWRGRG